MKIDNYSLSQFKTCPKSFEFRIEEGIVSNKPNLPAQFGIAIHAGLDAFYANELHHTKGMSLGVALDAFLDSWKEFDGLDSKGLYTAVRGIHILTEYESSYNNIKPMHQEIGMAVPLKEGYDIILTGRIDLIGEFDDALYVIDHKTRSKSLNTFSMQPNYALLGYSLGVKETLGLEGYPPIMVNLIKVAKTYDSMVLRMLHYPSLEEVEKFMDDTIYWCARIEDCRSFRMFPRVGDEFKCAWCDYKEICVQPELTERLIENGTYRKEEWKPY